MAKDKKLDRNVPDLLIRYHREVAEAAREAVRDALLSHKLMGNSVAVEVDGKVVLLAPNEIDVDCD